MSFPASEGSDSSELPKRGWDNVATLPWTPRGGGNILPSSNTKGALPPGISPNIPVPQVAGQEPHD